MHFPKWWSESIMRGIDENQMFNRGLATTLVVLAACFGLDHPVCRMDATRRTCGFGSETCRPILKKRWAFVANASFGVSSILNPTSPRRVALDHAEDVLLVHLRSGSNAFRQLWTWPLVVLEERQTIHAWVRSLDQWSAAGMATLDEEIAALEQHPDFETDPASP